MTQLPDLGRPRVIPLKSFKRDLACSVSLPWPRTCEYVKILDHVQVQQIFLRSHQQQVSFDLFIDLSTVSA